MSEKIRSKKVREFIEVLKDAIKNRVQVGFMRTMTIVNIGTTARTFKFAKLWHVEVNPWGFSVWVKFSKTPYSLLVRNPKEGVFQLHLLERYREVAKWTVKVSKK